jgi:hypothetical protein
MAALGSRQDNQKNTHKIISDNSLDEIATRVSDPLVLSKLDDIALPYIGSITMTSAAAIAASSLGLAANPSRKYLLIQNTHPSKAFWFNFTAAATAAAPSIFMPAGSSYELEGSFVTTQAINIIRDSATSIAVSFGEGV